MSTVAAAIKQSRPFGSKAEEAAVALLLTADLVRRNLAAVLGPHDLTSQQYNVLRILRGAGERGLPVLDVAERMIEETPGITRLLDRLDAKGLVTRERCTEDRRRVYCRITKAGLELLDALDAPLRALNESSLGKLKKRELTELVALLDRTRDTLHESLLDQRRKTQ
jgi:DNA-binding MarR family transcriptional regulator